MTGDISKVPEGSFPLPGASAFSRQYLGNRRSIDGWLTTYSSRRQSTSAIGDPITSAWEGAPKSLVSRGQAASPSVLFPACICLKESTWFVCVVSARH